MASGMPEYRRQLRSVAVQGVVGAGKRLSGTILYPVNPRRCQQPFGARVGLALGNRDSLLFGGGSDGLAIDGKIELAQLRYLLPRLRGMWTHLERCV